MALQQPFVLPRACPTFPQNLLLDHDRNYRALMDMKISFMSTSMIGFECIWISTFMTLQLGSAPPTFALSLVSLTPESIAASMFVTLSGPPEICDAKAAISVCASFTILVPISWLASTLCAYNFLLARCPGPSPNTPCMQC